jgi:hypothetical protein
MQNINAHLVVWTCGTVFIEKIMVAQPVEKFCRLCGA